jgi:Double-stranded RNA binding motif
LQHCDQDDRYSGDCCGYDAIALSHCQNYRTLQNGVSIFPENPLSMTPAATKIHLNVRITEAQLGYLSYLYPDEDPEEALVKLLECDRLRALRRAERDIKVLHLDDDQPTPEPESESSLPAESENPIGALQEYCQSKALTMPTYEFEAVAEGFSCTVWVSGLTARATASAKKKAKTDAAALLLEALAGAQVYRA